MEKYTNTLAGRTTRKNLAQKNPIVKENWLFCPWKEGFMRKKVRQWVTLILAVAMIVGAVNNDYLITLATNADGTGVEAVSGNDTVETVCLLSKLHEAKHHVRVKLDMDEMDITSAESKATYEEIKKYVAEHNDGMKASSLNIAQVKAKYGIIERENYNKAKSEEARQPVCPKDKEEAIVEALKAFRMI